MLRSRTALEVARGLRAFLNLEAGVTRGDAGREAGRGTARQGEAFDPARIVWIFGSNRTGSTWLSSMMGGMPGHAVWDEPLVGKLFGDLYFTGAAGNHGRRDGYIFADRHREAWLASIRSFVLGEAGARHPGVAEDGYLIIKEPNGSVGATLLAEALPESRVVLLVRDPRDAVASALDAHRKGSWQYENAADDRAWKRRALADTQPDAFVRGRANNYLQNVGRAKEAYEAHKGPKALVRYEDLRADTLGTVRRVYGELGIPVREGELARSVEKHAWENIPQDKKGGGKFYRKAEPGGWREDLTPGQVEIVERVCGPLIGAFYPRV